MARGLLGVMLLPAIRDARAGDADRLRILPFFMVLLGESGSVSENNYIGYTIICCNGIRPGTFMFMHC